MSISTPSTPSVASNGSMSPFGAYTPSTPPNLHQNSTNPDTPWLVQKFGGTSIGKFAAKIADDVVSGYLDNYKVAVVCSARSGSTKALGTTNLLLRAASEALSRSLVPPNHAMPGIHTPFTSFRAQSPELCSPPSSPFPRKSSGGRGSPLGLSLSSTPQLTPYGLTVDLIRSEHLTAARSLIRDQVLLKELEQEIEKDCEGLRTFLFAAQVIDEISPRSKDSIVGIGERMACRLIAAALKDRGIDSELVSLENIVPPPEDRDGMEHDRDGLEGQLDQSFYDDLAKVVGERIRQCGNRVPVVTGFFGPVPGSLLRQVGRGYTDLLAALLAVGLAAEELQIWKEVDGIFTADPRKVPTARLISSITPEEAAELTYYGSEVVHPFTMEQVIRKKIPIRIKNVENPTGNGTVIYPNPDGGDTPDSDHPPIPAVTTLQDLSLNNVNGFSTHRLPTAVTIKEGIIILNINSNRKSVSHGFLARIFATLDRFGVVVDLISTSEVHISMAVEKSVGKKALDRLVIDLQRLGTVTVQPDMAILSLVGKQMRNLVGIAGRMFSTLAEGNVNIEMISQGASEINISCVVDGRDAAKALNLIHQSCLQIRPEGAKGRVGPWLF